MADRPNVLLVVVDSLRADVVADDAVPTPTLDELTRDGVTFSQCISQGISTAPAMTAMLTGRLPLDYGGHWYLDADQPTFAQSFQNAGYNTGAVHSNPYVSARRNFDRGFDRFEEDVVAFEPDRTLERAPEKLLRLASRLSRILSKTPYTPAETVNEQVLDVTADLSEPWFCWAQYMDVHGPYLGGEFTYRRKFRAEWLWRKAAVTSPEAITDEEHAELWDHYEREVAYVDRQLGRLLEDLDERGDLEDTVVIVTADHGDEFGEHGRYGHGNLPYDELVHVPLLVRFPDGAQAGTVVDELVRSMDILPTALEYAGVPFGDAMAERMAGTSLLPLVRGEEPHDPIERAVTEKRVRDTEALRIAIRTDRFKYIFDGQTDETGLYDLEADPDEQADVSAEESAVADRFAEDLQRRFERIRATSEGVDLPTIDTEAGVQERLRALGYRD
jgi:arylsulfatase A-like enzyme